MVPPSRHPPCGNTGSTVTVGVVIDEPHVPTRHSPLKMTDTNLESGLSPSAVAFSEIWIVLVSKPALARYAAISSDVVSASVLFWYAVFKMNKKYGKFSLGVPSAMSFGALRGFATDEADAEGEPEEPFDGTGMGANEHELTVRATPTANADTSTRRNGHPL